MKRIKIQPETVLKVLAFLAILSWFLIVGFDINVGPAIDVAGIILFSIVVLIVVALVVHDRKNIIKAITQNKKKICINLLKFSAFIIIFVSSIRGGGTIVFWVWIIIGLYKLWLIDNEESAKSLQNQDNQNEVITDE